MPPELSASERIAPTPATGSRNVRRATSPTSSRVSSASGSRRGSEAGSDDTKHDSKYGGPGVGDVESRKSSRRGDDNRSDDNDDDDDDADVVEIVREDSEIPIVITPGLASSSRRLHRHSNPYAYRAGSYQASRYVAPVPAGARAARRRVTGGSIGGTLTGSGGSGSDGSEDEAEEVRRLEASATPLLFRFRYTDVETQMVRSLNPSDRNPFEGAQKPQKGAPQGRVMDVYVTIYGNRRPGPFMNKVEDVGDNLGTRPALVRIYSERLRELLKRLVGSYPGVSLKGPSIDIESPFTMLAHYYDELLEILGHETPGQEAERLKREGKEKVPLAKEDRAAEAEKEEKKRTKDAKVGDKGARKDDKDAKLGGTPTRGHKKTASGVSGKGSGKDSGKAEAKAEESVLVKEEEAAPKPVPKPGYDAETLADLEVLVSWFRPVWEEDYREAWTRHLVGVTTYADLPYLFRPNARVYCSRTGTLAGHVVRSVRANTRVDRGGAEREFRKQVTLHHLEYSLRRVRSATTVLWVRKFRGEKDVKGLKVFPAHFQDQDDGGKLARKLEERGRLYFDIVRAIPSYLQYNGNTWDMETRNWVPNKNPTLEYTGDIVIDYRPKAYRRRGGGGPVARPRRRGVSPVYVREASDASSSGRSSTSRTATTDSSDDSSDEEKAREGQRQELGLGRGRGGAEGGGTTTDGGEAAARTTAGHLHGHGVKGVRKLKPFKPESREFLSADMCFLFPRHMIGFALGKKQRMAFEVESITPIIWPSQTLNALNSLILDESDKDVIKALARKAARDDPTWAADFVAGKGEGQIFLLHGPPGTGKTFTVECVAKYTRRPLVRLTVADIGTDEREMEDVLGEWLQRATDWRAIILIDEADVFLEKRNVKDLQRNSLVSVFLSCLEYYKGMIFLTTNRIGQIDDAFLSRVSLAVTYQKLNAGSQQRLWHGFLQKLADERRDIVLTDRAKRFVDNMDKGEQIPWNGREIRNALQSAIALATFDAEQEAEAAAVAACGGDGAAATTTTTRKAGKIVVRDEHFQIVVDRKKEFLEYRKSIRNQDEDTRAWQEGSRPMPKRPGASS